MHIIQTLNTIVLHTLPQEMKKELLLLWILDQIIIDSAKRYIEAFWPYDCAETKHCRIYNKTLASDAPKQ